MQTTTISAATHPLILPTCRGLAVIDVRDIVRIEASSSYSRLFFANGKKLVVAKVLRWFEQQLPAGNFVRIHRTHLVNSNYIQHYMHSGKITLAGGECLDVARRKRRSFLSDWRSSTARSPAC